MSAPTALERLAADLRYLAGLPGFLRHTISLEEARATVERMLATREASFLDVLRHGVYDHPESPYYKLLAHAGIEFADVERGVRSDGLEATLEHLYDAGVYVTSEEMKGRAPIRRNGLEIDVIDSDFNNPLDDSPHILRSSTGTSGRSSIFRSSLAAIGSTAVDIRLGNIEQLGDRPLALWIPGDLMRVLWYAKAGRSLQKIYFTNGFPWTVSGLSRRFTHAYAYALGRLFGTPMPWSEVVSRSNPLPVARWLAAMKARGTPGCLIGDANPAVRVALAAKEHGLDISGTLFSIGGEPYTPGKAAAFASVGATAVVSYGMSEIGGVVARTCHHATQIDDAHFFSHRLALIQRERQLLDGVSVGELIYTTVHPQSPKLMINAHSGDYGTVTTRECPCMLGRVGLNTHLHGVGSYEKLTSEGITFISSRLYELIEQVLPARFGGGINDYQLVEEEQPDGLSRVSVVVSPAVGAVDESAVVTTVLNTLAAEHDAGGAVMAEMWRQGGNLKVVRREPHVTGGVKVLPLHVLTSR